MPSSKRTKHSSSTQKYPQAVIALALAYQQMGNYKQAMEWWIKSEQLQGNEARARELRQVFEKSGYTGYLRKAAKDLRSRGPLLLCGSGAMRCSTIKMLHLQLWRGYLPAGRELET